MAASIVDKASRGPSPRPPVASHKRHIAKAISWRIVGTLDTLILSFVLLTFLGPWLGIQSSRAQHVETASYIAGTEVVTKILLYYFHERLWTRFDWGRQARNPKLSSSIRRSSVKAITWRVLASLDTALLAFIFTGNLTMAVSIGGSEVLTKLLLYIFHERLWARIHYGLSPGG
jgi:uncharacterized membrane protein